MGIKYVRDQSLDQLEIDINLSGGAYYGSEEFSSDVLIDLDREGTPLRITIRNASKKYSAEVLDQFERWNVKDDFPDKVDCPDCSRYFDEKDIAEHRAREHS